ncbi:MAG: PQQ-dependent sugar dehydrogenase, partial [Chloroflexota bacterium]|nr:PQQ-dependent sugar dehydrogenase [Chloroflexota bacterium]
AGQTPRVLYLPPGFSASVFARLAGSPVRSIAVAGIGAVYVGVPRNGLVDLVADRDGDGFAEVYEPALRQRRCPYGLTVWNDHLYVAETTQVSRFPLAPGGTGVLGAEEVLVEGLPEDACGPHGFRPLAVDPIDESLYVALGSSCNVCLERGPGATQRARVWRYSAVARGEGSEVARGLRNVTDFALNPWGGALWGVAAERDDLGDDEPPELITEIRAGADYGWPSCYYGSDAQWHADLRVSAPGAEGGCQGLTPPTTTYQAHTAPLGLAFHDGVGLPDAFGPSLFVALHGSWDHSTGVGYKIVRLPLDESGQPDGDAQEFALGWLPRPTSRASEDAWGRPVDIAVGPDGALYVSDDGTGSIYRFSYDAP